MATKEDNPDSWKKSFADSAELKLVMGLLRRKVTAPNGDKQKKDASKKARMKKVRRCFLFVISAILVVIFIGYYGTRDFGKLYDASTPVKKDNIHPYAIRKDLDKAATKRSNAVPLQREKPEIQRHSSTKLDDVRPKSPEKSRNLTQGSDIIPKKNSLAVEDLQKKAGISPKVLILFLKKIPWRLKKLSRVPYLITE
jgi:hypothetical protein